MTGIPLIRDAIYTGLLYPDSEEELRAALSSELGFVPEPETCLRALISPHAAFSYAANIMAAAWGQVCARKTDRLVIIADLHPRLAQSLFPGVPHGILIPPFDYFSTPIGAVPVDQEACREIEACSTLVTESDTAHHEESAIELQALFAAYLLPGVPIVPVLMFGGNDIPVQTLARSLDYLFPEPNLDTVFIASCNMGAGNRKEEAERTLAVFGKAISENRPDYIIALAEDNPHEAYRNLSIGVLLSMKSLQKRPRRIIVSKDSSAFCKSPSEPVVNYGAAGWYDAKRTS